MKKTVLATLMLLAALAGKAQGETDASLAIARQARFLMADFGGKGLACLSAKKSEDIKPTGAVKEDMPFKEFGNSLPAQAFHGEAYRNDIIDNDTVFNFPQTNVITFAPGSHSNWHRHGGMDIHKHPGGQILIVTDGVCYHQVKGKKVEVLHPGDVGKCPPGEIHWHGAAPGSRMAHLAIGTNPGSPKVQWFKPVSKKQYDKIQERL